MKHAVSRNDPERRNAGRQNHAWFQATVVHGTDNRPDHVRDLKWRQSACPDYVPHRGLSTRAQAAMVMCASLAVVQCAG